MLEIGEGKRMADETQMEDIQRPAGQVEQGMKKGQEKLAGRSEKLDMRFLISKGN